MVKIPQSFVEYFPGGEIFVLEVTYLHQLPLSTDASP